MGKRKKRNRSKMFLWDDVEEINEMAIELPMDLKKRTGGGGTYFGGGAYNQGGTGGFTGYVHCKHQGDALVLEKDGKKLFGASRDGLNPYGGWGLVIDCANVVSMVTQPTIFRAITAKPYKVLEKYLKMPPPPPKLPDVLGLDWPDGGVMPALQLEFWEQLWQMLPERTVACCFGGHGRTGTTLTALCIASGMSYYDALKLVREKHCKKAVETTPQVNYLYNLWLQKIHKRVEGGGEDGAKAVVDWEYAKAHVPTAASDYGTEEVTKRKDSPSTITAMVVHGSTKKQKGVVPTGVELDPGKYRILASGKIQHLTCMDKYCPVVWCEVTHHQEWVEWDFEAVTRGVVLGK